MSKEEENDEHTIYSDDNNSDGWQSAESVEGCKCKQCKLCLLHQYKNTDKEIQLIRNEIKEIINSDNLEKEFLIDVKIEQLILLISSERCYCWY